MAKLPEPPQGLENKCNTILNDLVTQLSTKQETYKTEDLADPLVGTRKRGKYFQGLRVHDILPSEGNETVPDRSKKPTDQIESWEDAGITLPSTMPLSVRVDVYNGLQGWGFVVIGELEVGNKVWRRAINVGPESYRNTDGWIKIT